MVEENIWNTKEVRYFAGLKYGDFIVEPRDATVVEFENPINEGEQPGWSYKNLVTRDIGSDKMYVAWINFDEGGGHDYHAHTSDEIIHMLEGRMQFAYYSKSGQDIKKIIKKGDSAFAPAGTPHSVWNVDPIPCRFIVIKSPPFFLEEIPLPEEIKNKQLK